MTPETIRKIGRFNRLWCAAVLGGSLVAVTACSSGPKMLQVNIQGTQDMNNRRSCVVYVYLLKTNTSFLSTTNQSYWEDEQEAFADDIVAKRRYQLVPGETKAEGLKLTDEVNFIGAIADFVDPDREGWRRILPLPKKKPDQVFIIVDHNSIEIQ